MQLIIVVFILLPRTKLFAFTDAVFVGGILLPHGDFALDPSFFLNGTIERNVANDVARGARQAGRWLVERRQRPKHRYLNRVRKTFGANTNAFDDDEEEEPMIVLVTTPHGIKLDYDYGIYVSATGGGTATIGGDCVGFGDSLGHFGKKRALSQEEISRTAQGLNATNSNRQGDCHHKPYNVTLNSIDLAPTALAEDLLALLRKEKNHPVSGLYSYNGEAPIPLNWGEIIPLLLLPTMYESSSSSTLFSSLSSPRKTIHQKILPLIWTFPERRYNHSVEMVPELLQIGADLMEWAEQRPEKIAIIVSGDLSHTHQSSGPYGYSAASGPYDHAIGRWAGGTGFSTGQAIDRGWWDPCQPEASAALLDRAMELQPNAKSCGFTGYAMWHGMMCPPAKSEIGKSAIDAEKKEDALDFRSKVLVNRNVTYYGMISAIFEPHRKSEGKHSTE